jgi:hypothetical protein
MATPTLGVEWYGLFWEGFLTDIQENNAEWEKVETEKEWSTQMFGFLEKLAEAMNYHVKKEEKNIRGGRFDMVWRSSDTPTKTIYIEHENNWVSVAVKEEVQKLANYRANLHVCITYVKNDEFPGDNYAEQAKKMLEDVGYGEEFLLILGAGDFESPTDWICHRIYPSRSIAIEKVVLPSPVYLRPGEQGEAAPKVKEVEEVEDWMRNRLRVWKRIEQKGGSVTREELHVIAKQVEMDNRGLGGFFVGKNRSLFWKKDRAYLSNRALEYVKKLGDQVN